MSPRKSPFRRYEVRVFDARYQVLTSRKYEFVLNLSNPKIEGRLDRILASVTESAIEAGEAMDSPRIELWDIDTGLRARDWDGA